MKEIQLTQGKIAMVSDEDYDIVNNYKWQSFPAKHTTYAKTSIGSYLHRKTLFMHRFILGITDSKIIGEHKDGNGLNNQRGNIRIANQSKNRANASAVINSSSKYKGVSWSKTHNSWFVLVCKDYKYKYIGRFKNEIDAALAYNEAAKKLHGEFAKLNIIEN